MAPAPLASWLSVASALRQRRSPARAARAASASRSALPERWARKDFRRLRLTRDASARERARATPRARCDPPIAARRSDVAPPQPRETPPARCVSLSPTRNGGDRAPYRQPRFRSFRPLAVTFFFHRSPVRKLTSPSSTFRPGRSKHRCPQGEQEQAADPHRQRAPPGRLRPLRHVHRRVGVGVLDGGRVLSRRAGVLHHGAEHDFRAAAPTPQVGVRHVRLSLHSLRAHPSGVWREDFRARDDGVGGLGFRRGFC